MKKLVIKGGKSLTGTIHINGAKNSVVALLPAAILSDELVTIKNVPNITDVDCLTDIIKLLNGKIKRYKKTIKIDASNIKNSAISKCLSNKLRASYYFMGALLSKFKHVEIYFPGGCNFGARQIDYHLKGFESLGAKVSQDGEKFIIDAKNLTGTEIVLPFPSVGATINIMLASVKATGKTVIKNAAMEPEIENVAELLNKMGANISGIGTNEITIVGVDYLKSATIEVIPDRIEAGTYIIAGALVGDNLKIDNINPKHIKALLEKFDEMKINYKLNNSSIILNKATSIKAIDIKTDVYPGFPTDLAQPICVVLSMASGTSHVIETIYKHRMGHVEYLNKMGANIKALDNIEEITGPISFSGTEVSATDLRAGATLFLAALTTSEETTIDNIEHILRGYENIVKKLSDVGANIRIKEIE
jgi:UDP-N-acetylglucosamine 1-carboxyvinyltransferase